MNATVFEYQKVFYLNQMKGLLFDICNVYVLICNKGQQIKNDENTIRDEFGSYFENQDFKETTTTAKDYFFESEGRQQKTAGRVDIRFLSPNCYGHQDAYLAIECKRLDGKARLSKEYVENGIRRFTMGKYSSLLGCNAMMWFIVRTLNVDETCNAINTHLTAQEYLAKMHEELPNGCYKFESKHLLEGTITLLHLWLDFTPCIEKSKE